MGDMRELEKQIAAATGPVREIDYDLARFLGWSDDRINCQHEDGTPMSRETLAAGDKIGLCVPRFTSSLDSALELFGRVLPNWDWMISTTEFGYVADIAPEGCPGGGPTVEHRGSAALTLCLAIVRALVPPPGGGG